MQIIFNNQVSTRLKHLPHARNSIDDFAIQPHKPFQPGQGFVALSRVQSMSTLHEKFHLTNILRSTNLFYTNLKGYETLTRIVFMFEKFQKHPR